MSQQDVITQINQVIIANGQNLITASNLNPVLKNMVNQINEKAGELTALNTQDKTSLVAAINSALQAATNQTGGVTIKEGTTDPNITPPATYTFADFYKHLQNGQLLGFYIYNGQTWVKLTTPETAVKRAIREITNSATVLSTDHTIIYNGAPAIGITLPLANLAYERELRIVNRSDAAITLSTTIQTPNPANNTNTIPAHTVVVLHSTGSAWNQTN